ncbi:MAG: hypothetical protein ACOYMA_06360 [Bacteroidia bacterium]
MFWLQNSKNDVKSMGYHAFCMNNHANLILNHAFCIVEPCFLHG